ncbi:hypothetical protein FOZ62_002563 [Perkinsus olseni]|uniref:Uncharacterized protein n=1 Tax=Perkinsus olseni TaxID=32597 RepID=A0A7J6U9N8_PEROL|nr:hypothetical protein FOZ62_002563 [Perkinsus olseni]
MRSTAALSSATAAVLGAHMLQNAAASKIDYACHFPDDSTVPISCIVSAVKKHGVFHLGKSELVPVLYSQHTAKIGEDGTKEYISDTCTVNAYMNDGQSYLEGAERCYFPWLTGGGYMNYTSRPHGYSTSRPADGGEAYEQRHFQKLEMLPLDDVPFRRVGQPGDTVAVFTNDKPTEWNAYIKMGPKNLITGKRSLYTTFYKTVMEDDDDDDDDDDDLHWVKKEVSSRSTMGAKIEVHESTSGWGQAFFFKLGTSIRPGIYAMFLAFNANVYILFDKQATTGHTTASIPSPE